MNKLQNWLNADLLPPETSTEVRHGFFAEFYADGQLQHFAHYFEGKCDHSWCLNLEHSKEVGTAVLNNGSGGTADYETFRDGKADMNNLWSDNEPPKAIDYESWVVSWIRQIVQNQVQARQLDERADHIPRMALASSKTHRSASHAMRGHFVCPRCGDSTFQRMYALSLNREDLEELQIQLCKCMVCLFHGIAFYKESRTDNGPRVQIEGFPVGSSYWKSIASWIESCPQRNDRKCDCYSHEWLAQQGRFPELSQHAEWFELSRD
jgi:hypothetical protein